MNRISQVEKAITSGGPNKPGLDMNQFIKLGGCEKDNFFLKSKWHNIAIQTNSFDNLKEIQKQIPIRASIPQVIEWLIRVGQKQIKSELPNE